jgi:hypothetical protein
MIFSIKDKIMVTLQGSEHIAQMTRGACAVSQLVQTEATGLFVVFSQGKPHFAIYQATVIAKLRLVSLMEDRVVDVRPNFLEREGTAINGNIRNPSLVGFGKCAFLARIVEISHA